MSVESSKAKLLGAFLKSRRDRLQPEQAGIHQSYGKRRAIGLRREEVATLAGVSATYYTWLEQGREVTASKVVIESLAKALQLTADERNHFLKLWDPNDTGTAPPISTTLNPQWRNIIDQLSYPSFISNEKADVLAWNRGAAELLADFSALPEGERNMLRLLFTSSELRRRMLNWEEFASHSVAVFRTYFDKYIEDPWFKEIVEQLCEESADFTSMWRRHDVQLKKVSRVTIQQSDASKAITYEIQSLASAADYPDLHFCIYTPIQA
ncbi:transcriptional regulator with XRE-family HTH domain [Paenibacillus endophyticus]|uniref:Transcriptional regulator with XRE-family HTH domain n=1 Tax=Paenibacillus endophyticus TaxID=1294268 RepID=A0A7W5G995_9BACL|nr:helix-turn-helix transcriptional regulator [Paenibacillus endophyticus]MBB3151421.1 transcriptional regulator with XRE-family HTH domain [Paenibacillus endophyticus]